MSISKKKLLQRAIQGKRESKNLDFKTGFDVGSRAEWCEIIKDIVAFANSGGGAIVLGANDDGSPTNGDVARYLNLDPADITNKISAYTGTDFAEFEIIEIEREGRRLALLAVYASEIPMVFVRNGADQTRGGKQRPAFVKGTVYFRHGAKSEPGTSNDLREWLARSLDAVRETWLGGIRKVVEAGAEEQVHVFAVGKDMANGFEGRISNLPGALPLNPQKTEEIWPYTQRDLIERVLPRLPKKLRFNGYDVFCIKKIHNISPETRPEFVFKPHERASPQYSREFAEWIVEKCHSNAQFLSELRREVRKIRMKSG